jgi:hypothetical protein
VIRERDKGGTQPHPVAIGPDGHPSGALNSQRACQTASKYPWRHDQMRRSFPDGGLAIESLVWSNVSFREMYEECMAGAKASWRNRTPHGSMSQTP